MTAVEFSPWSVEEILEYLREYSCVILVKDGKPSLRIPQFPEDKWGREKNASLIEREILPHLCARRAELIEYLRQSDPDVRAALERAKKREQKQSIAEYCQGLIESTMDRAKRLGKRLYYMARPHLRPVCCGNATPPQEACFICAEGDERWTILPGALEPVAKLKKKPKMRSR